MRDQAANRDALIARLAARQHGVVSAHQLRSAGLDKRATSRRVAAGRLHRIHRGVYAVGHPRLTFQGRCVAALLACLGVPRRANERPARTATLRAAISHTSAAALWGMLPHGTGPIEVTLPTDGGRAPRAGITLHFSPSLTAGFATRRNGIPLTTPERTLRDLKRTAPAALQRAVRRAVDLRLVGVDALGPDPDLTRSKLERRFLALCRRHRLPMPEVNARVDRYEVDFLWREDRVIVETDSWRHHGDRAAFEADRARDARLQSLGYRVLRFTWRQTEADPSLVADALRALLA